MNHDNDYHDDVNYGNRFPDDYYFINEKDSTIYKNKTQDDYKKCYKPYRTLKNY